MVKNLFHTLLLLGIEEDQPAHDKRRIKTINLLNGLVAFFLLVGFFNYFVLMTEMKVIPSLVFLLVCFVSIFLSKIRLTNLSFLLFTLNVNFAIFFINETYPLSVGCYTYYFPVLMSVVLLNKPSIRDKHAIFHLAICLFFFIANVLVDVPEWHITNLSESQIQLMLFVNLGISAALIALLSALMNRLISNQHTEIMAQNLDLQKTRDELNVSLKEKEVLLAELHHRVKNNLAIITGLLNLQEEATTSHEARQIIGDSKSRIMSMALVHKMLYERSDLKSIDVGKYASELVTGLFDSYNLSSKIELIEEYQNIILPISKSVPLGLILNEIVTNCIKYVFQQNPNGKGILHIQIELINGFVYLRIRDNGPGFPQDFNHNTETPSLGIYLIKTLAEQIDGRVHFSNENGAKIELIFGHH